MKYIINLKLQLALLLLFVLKILFNSVSTPFPLQRVKLGILKQPIKFSINFIVNYKSKYLVAIMELREK